MSSSLSLFKLIKKDSVTDSGRLVIAGRLEGEPFAVGTDYRVRRLVAFVVSPMGHADVVSAIRLQFQLPDVDVSRVLPLRPALLTARLDERILAVGKDAFNLVVLVGDFAVDRDLPGVEVNAKYVGVRRAVAYIDQFRVIVAEVLGFERAFRRFGADDFLLVLQRGRAVLVDDVGGVDYRLAFSQLIGILSTCVRPGDLHLLTRDGDALGDFVIEWRRRLFGVRLQHPHFLVARTSGPDVVERPRADQEEVAVRQILDAEESFVEEMTGQQADHPGLKDDLECVAETLAHKSDALAVRRPRSALAKSGQLSDAGRRIFLRVTALFRLPQARRWERKRDHNQNPKTAWLRG